jgi:hypothetical protein
MSIRWNGRDFEDALNKAAFTQVRDNVQKRLRTIRCPEHGTMPTSVTVTGHDLKSLQWQIHGDPCCPKLTEAIGKAFR